MAVLHVVGAALLGLGVVGIGINLTVSETGWSPGPIALIALALGTILFITTWGKDHAHSRWM
jgi:hypothetical protein